MQLLLPTFSQPMRSLLLEMSALPHATPTIISKFNCDFIIQFHTAQERDLVCSYGKLEGNGFRMQLVPWGNLHGGNLVDWETKVTIDVTGFPPHAFDPIALTPLLAPHCNIQTYGFNKAKGICRVDGYALSVDSAPDSGHLAIQFPTQRGVRNIVFPAKMKTYLYNQAPDLGVDESNLFADRSDVAEYKGNSFTVRPFFKYNSFLQIVSLKLKFQTKKRNMTVMCFVRQRRPRSTVTQHDLLSSYLDSFNYHHKLLSDIQKRGSVMLFKQQQTTRTATTIPKATSGAAIMVHQTTLYTIYTVHTIYVASA